GRGRLEHAPRSSDWAWGQRRDGTGIHSSSCSAVHSAGALNCRTDVMRQQVDREIAVAQLPHPGKEWRPNKGTLKRGWTDWNDGHARKFLLHRGTYLDEQGKPIEAPIT